MMISHNSRLETASPSGTADLRTTIERCARLLPSQGPITAFVHHNTLHAMEDLPFHEAVAQASRLLECRPYLPEAQYRQLLESGRIRRRDLHAVVLEELGDDDDVLVGRLGTRYHLRLAMLQHPIRLAPDPELNWAIAETGSLRRFRPETEASVRHRMINDTRRWVMRDLYSEHDATTRPDLQRIVTAYCKSFGTGSIEAWDESAWERCTLGLLWSICLKGVQSNGDRADASGAPARHTELLQQVTGVDGNAIVNEVLIRWCAAFLDQGFARWPMPQREQGFFHAVLSLNAQKGAPSERWLRGWPAEARRLLNAQRTPLESIGESLELLGVPSGEHESFITQTLLSLRGWAGMICQLETLSDRVAHAIPAGSLIEFLAVRLALERIVIANAAREEFAFARPLAELRSNLAARLRPSPRISTQQQAFKAFQLAQVRGWYPRELDNQSSGEWRRLQREIGEFSEIERCRIYQIAYERRFRQELFDALAVCAARTTSDTHTPRFQLACCLDDREESFRRHVEEVASDCETFGVAGFYGVAMYYQGAADARYQPLCPVVIQPEHYVREEVTYPFGSAHRRRTETRRALGTVRHHLHLSSRTFLGGILTALVGALASIPMVARILFPRITARIRDACSALVRPPAATRLQLERSERLPSSQEGHIGFSLDEMVEIVFGVLHDLGLVARFSRLVIITGHGSSSLNNPHASAYNCGACAGRQGGPNARAFAQMANDPRVRSLLAQRDLVIPHTTWFVGAYHNTCNDEIDYYDLDRMPTSHWNDFEAARRDIDEARRRNAHERCRRFGSASLTITPEEALRHVEVRAEDLSQARPEFNHATSAAAIVGRRSRTRGLFLDRRVFLTSYDPTIDDEQHTILERILRAAIPVCAGISLEYYFSCVDPDGWGCGSKLPHNVTSLLGVMTGAASDLRPGLSTQMVEIHEPLRPLFVIETTPDAMLQIMERNAAIRRLCVHQWVFLATLDPHSAQMHIFRDNQFHPYEPQATELPVCPSSADWYRGWRDHLSFAFITPPSKQSANHSAEQSAKQPASSARHAFPPSTP